MKLFSLVIHFVQTVVCLIARPLLVVLADFKVYGRENLKEVKGKNIIIAMNHVSQFDPIIISVALGFFSKFLPLFWVAREKEFYKNIEGVGKYLWGGFIFKLVGAFPVEQATNDSELSLQHHIKFLEEGRSLGIFPEGRRTQDGTMGKAKAGIAYMLWRTGVPVVPVALHGHYRMLPKHFFSSKHNISVMFGKPIKKEDLFGSDSDRVPPTHEEFKAASQEIMNRVAELYSKI